MRHEAPPRHPAALIKRLGRFLSEVPRAYARHSEPFDPNALDRRDPALIGFAADICAWMNTHYLSLHVEGLQNIPRTPVLYAANHNGGLNGPDLLCTLGTLWDTLGPESPLFMMAHDLAMKTLTPAGRLFQLGGALRADPRNAARAFAIGGQVLVYPGGELEAYRHFRDRDRIVFGERTGFVQVAREAGVPIVPVVAQGAHRSAMVLHEGEWLAQAIPISRRQRLRRFPIALALPWGLAIGPWLPYAPLPFPIRLRFLPPIDVTRGSLDSVRSHVVDAMQSALTEMAQDTR